MIVDQVQVRKKQPQHLPTRFPTFTLGDTNRTHHYVTLHLFYSKPRKLYMTKKSEESHILYMYIIRRAA